MAGSRPPSEPHDERDDERGQQELRRHRESERDLAERLKVHRRGLVAVERQPGDRAADDPADDPEQDRLRRAPR